MLTVRKNVRVITVLDALALMRYPGAWGDEVDGREGCSRHLISHSRVGAIPISRANQEVGKEVSEWVVS